MGILRLLNRDQAKLRVPGGCLYNYGLPAGDRDSATGVVAQWLFDEASGSIVDEVSSITLPEVGTASYSTAVVGDFVCLTPGITTNSGNFGLGSAVSSVDPGTQDFVWEWVAQRTSGTGTQITYESDRLNGQGWQAFHVNATSWRDFMKTDEGTTIDKAFTITDVTGDSAYHKYRVTFDRDGNEEVFLDGVSQGTASISAGDGENFSTKTLSVGGGETGASKYQGIFLEYRHTNGRLDANSGGPGGG